MVRFRLRKRRTVLLSGLVSCIIIVSLVLSNTVRSSQNLEIPNDYDLNYEQPGDLYQGKGLKEDHVVKKMVAIHNIGLQPNAIFKHFERKPQAHVGEDNHGAGGDSPQNKARPVLFLNSYNYQRDQQENPNKLRVQFNKDNIAYHMEQNGEANDDEEMENLVIEDDTPDEEDDDPYEDLQDNPEFKPGDFDMALMNNNTQPPLLFEEIHKNLTVRSEGPLGASSHNVKTDTSVVRNVVPLAGEREHNKLGAKGPALPATRGNHAVTGPQQQSLATKLADSGVKIGGASFPVGQGPQQDIRGPTQLCKPPHKCHVEPNNNDRNGHIEGHVNRRAFASAPAARDTPPLARGALPKGLHQNKIVRHSNSVPNKNPKVDVWGLKQRKLETFQAPNVNVYNREQYATQIQTPVLLWQVSHNLTKGQVWSTAGFPVVHDYIYWSDHLHHYVPKGVSDNDALKFIQKVERTKVEKMQPPLWNRCGRPKNMYITLKDGTALCARYRDPHNKLIQGEVLSFYLARLLGLDNTPIVVLSQVNSSAPQWWGQQPHKASWEEGKLVALIQWIDGVENNRVRMPPAILSAFETGAMLTRYHPSLRYMTERALSLVLQWTDMILFDYITGHYDRVASMQDGAEREHKPSIMKEGIRNLRMQQDRAKLWLIDNESGLFDAYELMYRGGSMGRRFITFHTQMLRTICIFRKSTADKIRELANMDHPEKVLLAYTQAREPIYNKLPRTKPYTLFTRYFRTRLKEAANWIESCRHR